MHSAFISASFCSPKYEKSSKISHIYHARIRYDLKRLARACTISGRTKANFAWSPTSASKQNFLNNAGVRTVSCVQGRLPSLFCDRSRCERYPRRRCGPRPALFDRHGRRKSWKSPRVEARRRPPAQELCLQGAKSPLVHRSFAEISAVSSGHIAWFRIQPTVLRSASHAKPSTLEASYPLLTVGNTSR